MNICLDLLLHRCALILRSHSLGGEVEATSGSLGEVDGGVDPVLHAACGEGRECDHVLHESAALVVVGLVVGGIVGDGQSVGWEGMVLEGKGRWREGEGRAREWRR